MTVDNKVFINAKIAIATNTTQYTAPTGTNAAAVIDKFTATNYDTVGRTISVNLCAAGDVVGDANLIVKAKTLQPGATYTFPELTGASLGPGGFISTIASNATGINIRASGREFT